MAIRRCAMCAAFIFLLLFAGCPNPAAGEPSSYHIDRLDVTLFVSTGGKLRVLERVQFNFTSGNFSMAYRTIPHFGFDGLEAAEVYNSTGAIIKNGYAYRFDWFRGEYEIRWTFNPVLGPGNATFTIDYIVAGAVVDVSRDQSALDWYAVGPGWGVPISSLNLTVVLPQNYSESPLLQTAPSAMERLYGKGTTYLFYNTSDVPAHSPVRVVVHYPKTAELQVSWQRWLRENWMGVAMLIFGITLAIFATISLLRFAAARLPPRSPRPNRRLHLQPAMLATLLAGRFDAGGLLAGVTMLGQKGAVRIIHDPSADDVLFETHDPMEPLAASDLMLLSALSEGHSAKGLSPDWPRLRLEFQRRYRTELRNEGMVAHVGRLSWLAFIGGLAANLVASIILGLLIYLDPWDAVLYGGILLGVLLAGIAVLVVGGLLTPNRTLRGARETAAQRAFLDDAATELGQTAASKPSMLSAPLLQLLPLLVATGSGRTNRFIGTLRRLTSANPGAPLEAPWYEFRDEASAGEPTLGRFGRNFSLTAQELPALLSAIPAPAEPAADTGLYTEQEVPAGPGEEKGGGKS